MKIKQENKIDFKKMLKNTGLKNTVPRLAVLKALSDVERPETAQEIFKKIGKNKIDLVTLYRTIASFEEKQLVKRIDLHKDSVYYELNLNHHHHIICTGCGEVEDFELCDMDRLTKKIVLGSSNFKSVREHTLELFGVCNACVKN